MHFSQAYNDVRNSQISDGKIGFNSSNVVMRQEITKSLNDLANAFISDRVKIEHLNSTNSSLSGHISKLEKLIHALH